MAELQDWEKALLVDTKEEITEKFNEIPITYRKMPWKLTEDIQTKCFVLNAKTQKMDLDTAKYSLEVLNWGVLKGPWKPEIKEACLLKLKPRIKDALVSKITSREDDSELKKK
jgi:hypothetical protein